jgi:uncharacterized membrane protein YphA (DoxX/SURF4 family)
MKLTTRLAHIALGVPFIWLGYDAASEPGGRVDKAAEFGLPQPHHAVRLNGVAMVAGGVGLSVGVFPRAAALGLAASLVPTTLVGHPFWQSADAQARTGNRIQFLKNLGLIGGLLSVAASSTER